MATCGSCGARHQLDSFCVNCGASMSPVDVAGRTALTYPPGWPPASVTEGQHFAQSPVPPQPEPLQLRPAPSGPWAGPPPASPRRRRSYLIAGLLAAVVLIGGTTIYLLSRPRAGAADGAADGAAPPTTPAVSSSATGSTNNPSDHGHRQAPPGSTTTLIQSLTASVPILSTTVRRPAPSTRRATPKPTPVDPMGGVRADFTCNSGYLVQVASELSRSAFLSRVAQIRAAKQLPPGAKWTQTSTSCPIYSGSVDAFVLFAGPFATPFQACPARLASPADAFIRNTAPEGSSEYVSCLCPADVGSLPLVSRVGQHGVWIGELQRVLTVGLRYPIPDLEPDPANGIPNGWGVFTTGTAAAVSEFRSDNALGSAGVVDRGTWQALQRQAC